MSFVKKLTALFMAFIILASCCAIANAATATVTVSGTYTVDTGVSYSKLSVKSGQNSSTVTGYSIEFNPDDGYFPMVFSSNAGDVDNLQTQYSVATGKYGYDVAGVVNGSFFTTETGHLVGLNISNGRIVCGHSGYTDEVVAFGSDGSMSIVTSCLEYKLFIDGEEIPDAIRYINKKHENDTTYPDKVFYYDTSCGTSSDTAVSGYEVICQKQNNTDLIVGGTLFAKVVEVKANTYGTQFESSSSVESDKFVLFVKSDSSYADYLKNLQSGDDIAISVTETNASAREVMENANSVITNVGWLVKDGVDRTRIDETIGTHSVTYEARWTAFGQKADGSYVFFVSDGAFLGYGGVTLRDVADYMISKGCVNVIRMDGGGSSAMYLKKTSSGSAGYTMSGKRSVADSILIVKKSSAVNDTLTDALNSAIAVARQTVAEYPNPELSAVIAEAEAIVASGDVVAGDARKMIIKLSGKDELFDAISLVSGVSYYDYSESVLSSIRDNYEKACQLYFASDADIATVQTVASVLKASCNQPLRTVISNGKGYTTTTPNRTDGTFDDDGVRLTDGAKCSSAASTNAYSGWSSGVDPVITVDLGESTASDSYTVYTCSMSSWGIPLGNSISVSVSDDGSSWTDIGTCADVTYRQSNGVIGTGRTNYYSFTVKADAVQTARYVRFSVDGNNHTWIDEVEVALTDASAGAAIESPIYINGINEIIAEGDCHVFTSVFGTVTAEKANHIYTANVLLTATDVANKYTVKSISLQNGTADDITLGSDEILLACHSDSAIPSSIANQSLLSNLAAGDELYVFGVTPESTTLGLASYARTATDDDENDENEGGNGDSGSTDETIETILGDVNNDAAVDSLDYILVKRACYKTYLLSIEEKQRADVDKNAKINAVDYLLIKRITFGTYGA